MADIEVFLDETPGETRGVIVRNGRFTHLILHRDSDRPSDRLGARCVGRIARVEAGLRGAFVDLGAGSLAKFIYHKLPATQIDVVEIDPQVEIVARLHFKLPNDPQRLRIAIDDGARFMLSGDSQYDCILVDGFDHTGSPGPLDTLPFYQACRARLSDAGLLAVNLLSRRRGFNASKARIAEAFDDRVLVFPSCESGNTIAFARGNDDVDVHLDDLNERAVALRRSAGLNLLPTLPRLQAAGKLFRDRLRF